MTTRTCPAPVAEMAIEAILTWFNVIEEPVGEDDLTDRGKSRYVFKVRATVAYFLKTEAGWSYPRIGRRLERDHTSVINMIRRIHYVIDEDDLDDVMEFTKERVAKEYAARHARLEAL